MSAEAIPESVPSASGSWPGITPFPSVRSALSGEKMIKSAGADTGMAGENRILQSN